MVVKRQCPVMAYSKTVVGITVGIADTLTRCQRQFPLHMMDDSYIAVDGIANNYLAKSNTRGA